MAFNAIVSALEATGEFAQVLLDASPDPAALGGASTPSATLMPTHWEEVGGTVPGIFLRSVTFALVLSVTDVDPLQRFEALDRLAAVVQDAINGSDLDGGCLPNLTMIRRGVYEPMTCPLAQKLSLTGGFTYPVPAVAIQSII